MAWRIGQFPELAHLEPGERAAVLRGVPFSTYPLVVARSAVLGAVLAVFPTGLVSSLADGQVLVAVFVVTAGTLAVLLYRYQLRGIRRAMRVEIARAYQGRPMPFCMWCGYDLRGVSGDRCPECGKSVYVRVSR